MIRFLLLGTSVPEEGKTNLWGIDVETYYVVNIKALSNIVYDMKVGYEYQVECIIQEGGFPVFSLKKIVEEKKLEREKVKELLDLASSYSRALISDTNSYMLTKMDCCKRVNIYQQHAEMILSVVGVASKDFIVEILDWHWNAYWKTQHQYAERESIVNYMNNRDVYMMINHNKNSLGNALQCMAMLVI